MKKSHKIGQEAIAKKGWLLANRFLLLRRLSQFLILAFFLVGPLFGIWILKGNLSSSILFDVIPFTDPFILMQSMTSGHFPLFQSLLGAGIVLLFYIVVGGRVFCSWVCPINLITDASAWCRRKLNFRKEKVMSSQWRYWILLMVMILPLFTGVMTWELINPVSAFHRGLFFGMGTGWILFLTIFVFDLLAVESGWCGHLCPVGAFYGLINKIGMIKVDAINRDKCTDCLDCFNVCPEPAILKGPVHGQKKNIGTLVNDMSCTNCGRCVDVCAEDVFVITTALGPHKKSLKQA
jgi:ferredoxin-type protein NapH